MVKGCFILGYWVILVKFVRSCLLIVISLVVRLYVMGVDIEDRELGGSDLGLSVY